MDVEQAGDSLADAEKRIGVFGGSFDPIHNGHLVIAEEARVSLNLVKVLFVPARVSPLKMEHQPTSAQHRCRMVRLAIANNPFFELSRIDLDRPGPSYTVDTLRLLKQACGETCQLYFIIGQDSLETLLHWRAPQEIIRTSRLVVARRPGYEPDVAAMESRLPGLRQALILLDTPELSVSSTDLRHRVGQGLPVRYQVPDAVVEYIEQHGLYQGASGSSSEPQDISPVSRAALHHHDMR